MANKHAPKRLRPFSVRFDDELLDELQRHAARDDRAVSTLIYRIVKDWLAANRDLLDEEH